MVKAVDAEEEVEGTMKEVEEAEEEEEVEVRKANFGAMSVVILDTLHMSAQNGTTKTRILKLIWSRILKLIWSTKMNQLYFNKEMGQEWVKKSRLGGECGF